MLDNSSQDKQHQSSQQNLFSCTFRVLCKKKNHTHKAFGSLCEASGDPGAGSGSSRRRHLEHRRSKHSHAAGYSLFLKDLWRSIVFYFSKGMKRNFQKGGAGSHQSPRLVANTQWGHIYSITGSGTPYIFPAAFLHNFASSPGHVILCERVTAGLSGYSKHREGNFGSGCLN